LTPNSLADRVTYLSAHPEINVVYGDGYYCNETGREMFRFSEHMPTGVAGDVFETLFVSPFYGSGATVLIRHQFLSESQIRYDESIVWCQDWDFYLRLAEKTDFGFVESICVRYRLHQGGMTLTMPQGRRLESRIRTRFKVMNSLRFNECSVTQRSSFFHDFLVEDLHDNVADQSKVFTSAQFRALPNSQQSRLLRIVAKNYLLYGKHIQPAKRWLLTAWARTPFDPRTGVVAAASIISSGFARFVVKSWGSQRLETEAVSPFELALASESHSG
jgi:hypothetical protein